MRLSYRYYFVGVVNYVQSENGKVSFSLSKIDNLEVLLNSLPDSKWKKIKLKTYPDLSSKSGIYAITITDTQLNITDIAYVGSSINLNKRFTSHQTLHFLMYGLDEKYKIDLYVCYCAKSYKSLESKAIGLFNPFLNSVRRSRPYIEYTCDNKKRKSYK